MDTGGFATFLAKNRFIRVFFRFMLLELSTKNCYKFVDNLVRWLTYQMARFASLWSVVALKVARVQKWLACRISSFDGLLAYWNRTV